MVLSSAKSFTSPSLFAGIALDKILSSRKIPHEYHLYPGRHDWSYFASHLEASLTFHSALFP